MSQALYREEWMNDEELIQALISGDESAGVFLVSRFAPRILGYCSLIARDLAETDRELLCERAVEKAVDKIDRFDSSRGSFPAWLRGILRNELREWRRERPFVAEIQEGAVAAPSSEPAPDQEDLPVEEIVSDLVAKLAVTDQLIIRLRDLEGLPYGSIADALGVQEAACRQRHKRALSRLRDLANSPQTKQPKGGSQ
jgi:RNA polymerase sigma factor (sigma-70 family)